jgi:hypothetical protein
LTKQTTKKSESEKVDLTNIPFEDIVKRLVQTPPPKKSKPKEKKA